MSNRAVISTPNAPEAIGPYSQAIKVGNTIWLSGQIPLVPGSMELVSGAITAQAKQVFANLAAVAEASYEPPKIERPFWPANAKPMANLVASMAAVNDSARSGAFSQLEPSSLKAR